jgi:Flp pilus assembly protein TadG
MATAKTGSFYLTETVTIPAASASGARVQGVIDLGAYVSVAQGMAVAIESVDFIYQAGDNFSQAGKDMLQAAGALSTQLSDLNPGTRFVRADNQSLIASGSLNIDTTANVLSHASDLYPDNFGPAALSEAFMVVNDSLYLVGGPDNATTGTEDLYLTARIKCRVVKLGNKDWMAIAIQSTASDN